jgi:hypothetical protein
MLSVRRSQPSPGQIGGGPMFVVQSCRGIALDSIALVRSELIHASYLIHEPNEAVRTVGQSFRT